MVRCEEPGKGKTVGRHGQVLLKLLYVLGCATVADLEDITTLPRRTINRQLLILLKSRYVERLHTIPLPVTNGGMCYVYSLTKSGVLHGGGCAGYEGEDEAKTKYRRCRAKHLVDHRLMQVRFVALLTQATLHSEDEDCEITEFWGEHAPEFPLKASTNHTSALGGLAAGDLSPDGRVTIVGDFAGQGRHSLKVWLEQETGSRPPKAVLNKVLSYMAHIETLSNNGKGCPTPDDPGAIGYHISPDGGWPVVVFLFASEVRARRTVEYVRRGLEDHARYALWERRMRAQHNLSPGYFFLFSSLSDMSRSKTAALEDVFAPLSPYELRDRTIDRASLIKPGILSVRARQLRKRP